jgi:hypothetical protein
MQVYIEATDGRDNTDWGNIRFFVGVFFSFCKIAV